MRKLDRLLWIAPLLTAIVAHAQPIRTPVEAPGPGGPLKGEMLSPGPLIGQPVGPPAGTPIGPVALIIPGSGPTDRDGNNPLGIRASTYRLLAQDLAGRGITTVRIDKRGMFASAAATPDANAVTIADYASDTGAWIAALRQRTGAACVWLIGHSEGGLVAMAAAKSQAGVCGLVLVSAAGRPLGEVLREQLKANPANAPLLAQAMPAIDALEQGRNVETAALHPALLNLFGPQIQGFLISAFSYDPRRLLAGYRQPVLVVQGTRDIQVGEADARLLKQASPHAELVLLPDVNHVLKRVASEDLRANHAAYADPDLPLAPGVGSAVAGFIERHAAAAEPSR
ncbi:alpha/beta hydrolase [Pseudoduganella lutea]|uniref:Alpha/beta fold hydrolase n=1 Tax=Pseudoduganella lutea TaxID=321985 RepID=A0A4P6KV07_9BURK|nr:alpha/beta fold hydrolase [Pseudoduganella lutea]QBE62262.1 alpha/beta fold hydrolase [Pseudoduganella lutea]